MGINLQNTISETKIGSIVTIQKITAPKDLKQRLLSLGFIRGNKIELLAVSLAKESVVVKINSTNSYALRDTEAKHIIVK